MSTVWELGVPSAVVIGEWNAHQFDLLLRKRVGNAHRCRARTLRTLHERAVSTNGGPGPLKRRERGVLYARCAFSRQNQVEMRLRPLNVGCEHFRGESPAAVAGDISQECTTVGPY